MKATCHMWYVSNNTQPGTSMWAVNIRAAWCHMCYWMSVHASQNLLEKHVANKWTSLCIHYTDNGNDWGDFKGDHSAPRFRSGAKHHTCCMCLRSSTPACGYTKNLTWVREHSITWCIFAVPCRRCHQTGVTPCVRHDNVKPSGPCKIVCLFCECECVCTSLSLNLSICTCLCKDSF